MRRLLSLLALAALSLAFAPAPRPRRGPHEWVPVQIVSLKDFDNLEVQIDGEKREAFLVGLRPLRESPAQKGERERVLKEALAELKKSALFAQVVTRRGAALGLSLDAFSHQRHGFGHGWDPGKYPYCVTGWGAYNFNLYFLHRGYTTPLDNFGEAKRWREVHRLAGLKTKVNDKAKDKR